MTYCLAASVDDGLVFVSDSRTNAGIDQLGAFSKMHRFTELGGRFFTLLSAGNLATSQAVVARLNRDLRENAAVSLQTVQRMREAADYVGSVSKEIQARYPEAERAPGFSPDVDFIFGGQIGAAKHELFLVYSQGNYFSPDERSPFLQIGEQKYGKPILDRIIEKGTSLTTVALCGLVSMDSTMRSNACVGPPIELLIYRAGLASSYSHLVYGETDPYLLRIRESWAENLRLAFDKLPPISLPPSKVRLVDR